MAKHKNRWKAMTSWLYKQSLEMRNTGKFIACDYWNNALNLSTQEMIFSCLRERLGHDQGMEELVGI